MRNIFILIFSCCFVLASCARNTLVQNNFSEILGPNDQVAGHPIITAKKIETQKYPDGSPKEYKYLSADRSVVYAIEYINEKGGVKIEGKIPDGLILQYSGHYITAQLNYNAGRLEGVIKEFYPNGIASSVSNYKAGQLYGPSREYYPNGKIKKEAVYKNELLYGTLRKYSETGIILLVQQYSEGKLNGLTKEFYDNGKIKAVTEYLNGKKEGTQREFSSNGTLIAEYNYSAGKLEGQSLKFYEGGNIQSVMNYSNGKRNGETKIYRESRPHSPVYVDLYTNGKKTKRRAYASDGSVAFTMDY
ncbi:MAG: toxin-antitoxin system YwqK family antitoxin [Endomicrobia bacterium]|nr:toxin-antitoxin system YwqK family antitoxin [Endomicrobiia bacterium]